MKTIFLAAALAGSAAAAPTPRQCAVAVMKHVGRPPNTVLVDNIIKASYSKDPEFLKRLLVLYGVESTFDPNALSHKHAVGIGQLLPLVAYELADELRMPISYENLFQLEINVKLSSYLFKKLLTQFKGNVTLALVGYNAGPLWAQRLKAGKEIPKETAVYVARSSFIYERFCE